MANPFSQAKDLLKMQGEARKMQKEMKTKKFYGESNKSFVKVELNGTGDIENIEINDLLLDKDRKNDLISHLKDAYKDAQKKIAKDLAKDFDMSKLKDMFG